MVGYQLDDDSTSFHGNWLEITISIPCKKSGWIWSSSHSTWFGEFSSVAGQPSIFGWRNPGTERWYRANQHQPWAEGYWPFSFVLSYEFPRLHFGSLCSLLNSRLLVEINWIRKQEYINSSNLCVETPPHGFVYLGPTRSGWRRGYEAQGAQVWKVVC